MPGFAVVLRQFKGVSHAASEETRSRTYSPPQAVRPSRRRRPQRDGDRRDVILGKYGSPESRARVRSAILAELASPRCRTGRVGDPPTVRRDG